MQGRSRRAAYYTAAMGMRAVARWHLTLALVLAVGCVEEVDLGGHSDASVSAVDGRVACRNPANVAGGDVRLAAEFENDYTVYDLGQIAGVPDPLSGITLKYGDPNTLLVAGNSESAESQIYEVAVTRGPCGHILSFDGTATPVAQTPFASNLSYFPGEDLLFYSAWPGYTLSQLPFGASAPTVQSDLTDFGLPANNDEGTGGIGFVPSGFGASAGELRMVTWPTGGWYRVALVANGAVAEVTGITKISDLPNKPGGFAYVPKGSPGFAADGIIIGEFDDDDPAPDRVVAYRVDAAGDPLPASRREFLSTFPQPWSAYFEPLTGDFLFVSWGTGADHVYVIQGFAVPGVN